MAKSLALLSYEFLFDPSQTWAHSSQFESDFGKFLKEHNLEGEILDNINPKDGRKILYIKAIKQIKQIGISDARTAQKLNSQRSK